MSFIQCVLHREVHQSDKESADEVQLIRDHKRNPTAVEESDGQDSSTVQRLIVIVSN